MSPLAEEALGLERVTAAGAPVPTGEVPAVGAGDDADDPMAGLFGRGLLYVVIAALPFVSATVVSPILAYQLGPASFGLMASAIALHQLLTVLAMVGLDQAVVLQRAEDENDRAARGLLACGIVLAVLVTALVGVTSPFWSSALGFQGADGLVAATVLWTAPAVTVQLVVALLMGGDRLRAFAVVSSLSTVGSQLVGLLLLFTLSNDVQTYAWGGVLGQAAAMVVGLVLVWPSWRGLFDLQVFRRALALGFPLMLSGISSFVLNAGDRLVVQRVLGPAEAGRYQIAYTVGFIAVTVLLITGQAWAARIASIRDDRERWAVIGRSRDELYGAFAPMVLGVMLAAPLLLRLLAPPSFQPASLLGVVLLVLLSGIPVIAAMASSRALITARRTRPVALAAGVAAVVNVVLNLVLVPPLGLTGAAVATLIAFSLQALVQWFMLPSGLTWPRPESRRVRLLLVVVTVAWLSTLVPQDVVWITARTLLAAACLPWLVATLRRARSGTAASEPARRGRHGRRRGGRHRA
ncbi:lipopolysaccharide biosynthesis protein [Geodermatophilus sp. SYSU D00814]